MYQNNALEVCHHICQFRLIRLQEFSSCRHIIKQVLHREVTAGRTCHRLLLFHPRTSNLDHGAQLIFPASRLQFHLSHSGDTCQCFSPESHCGQAEEIRCFLNLRGGMAFERESRIRFRHTLAVIYHLHIGLATIRHQHLHILGTSINRVLSHLLDDGRRTLHHLASSNLIGDRIW